MEHSMSEKSCQLCAVGKLTFEPPPIYCTPCGARVKRNAMYYTMGTGDTRHYFCIPCYKEASGDTIVADGTAISKARLEKKKNDEETEERWVQCDKCEAWQHQICALFNGTKNDGGQAKYTCSNCFITEVERGERKTLPQSVLGAKDLPRTILSDHIEQRLFRKLKQERQERARMQGKSFDDNIEGVEVCLFGMYVQEFGSEAHFPNQRRVYLSYLDSVNYFRPEIKAVTGEALCTFVYHEILIGYIEYCKKRGFTSCYIWACPPLKGEENILYCHPEIQKMPKSDKHREWYLVMLRKAAKENVVVDLTNLYDHFFISTVECKAKVTAARLPYFEGDYWPGAAEDLIHQLDQEEDGRKQKKKGSTKKTITKRALKASGQADLSGNASKDLRLMLKASAGFATSAKTFRFVISKNLQSLPALLSGGIFMCYEVEQKCEEREQHPIKLREKHAFYPVEIADVPADTKDKDEIRESEFFDTRQAFLNLCQESYYQFDTLRRAKHSSMMVLYHLHNPTALALMTTCNICHLDVETGQGWRCEVCPYYDVCNSCYQKDGGMDHPHKLTNHPCLAERDVQNKEARQLRAVQILPDCHVCNSCYQKDGAEHDAQNKEARQSRVVQYGGMVHPHKLTNHLSQAERNAQNKEARKSWFLKRREMLDLVVHASQCRYTLCKYSSCRKMKGVFQHGMLCKTRASGGCILCKKMWYLLQLHARSCKESECYVPHCRDLRAFLCRHHQQSDSRRRAAVIKMMRQRAAKIAGNSG
ncbi:unnamed protein product [Dovyalis caffra]|uniref:histone acetyltransferase n=1 Tax=Dovyalis caffra TaxID=77055 RepID=A0AAV1RVW4_9ROSI|nr:unnamed protein product [Dovyalis caffra]